MKSPHTSNVRKGSFPVIPEPHRRGPFQENGSLDATFYYLLSWVEGSISPGDSVCIPSLSSTSFDPSRIFPYWESKNS